MAADVAVAPPPLPSQAPPTLLAETWHGLKQNRGAMAGLDRLPDSPARRALRALATSLVDRRS